MCYVHEIAGSLNIHTVNFKNSYIGEVRHCSAERGKGTYIFSDYFKTSAIWSNYD
jgi:hypothetical protein